MRMQCHVKKRDKFDKCIKLRDKDKEIEGERKKKQFFLVSIRIFNQ